MRAILNADQFNVRPTMLRRLAIIVFGALPASFLAFFVTFNISEGIYEGIRYGGLDHTVLLSLLVCASCLAGTSGLWMVAFQEIRIQRSKRIARTICVMLILGIIVAAVPLLLPAWWIRFVALCPIVTAAAVFPSIVRVLRRKHEMV